MGNTNNGNRVKGTGNNLKKHLQFNHMYLHPE